jgi:hypothetical protein
LILNVFVLYNKKKNPELKRQIAYFLSTKTFENLKKSKFYKYHACTICTNTALQSIIVDFNLLFTQMFRTSQIRYQVQKFTMKFTNGFVNWAFDWLVWFNSQSVAFCTNLFVNFIMNFWTWQRICEVRNEVRNIWVKSISWNRL